MNGKKNLIPMTRRTPAEQRAITVAGGRASGAARRKKKALCDALQALLEGENTDGLSGVESLALALFQAALGGDVAAIKAVAAHTGAGTATNAFFQPADSDNGKRPAKVNGGYTRGGCIRRVDGGRSGKAWNAHKRTCKSR